MVVFVGFDVIDPPDLVIVPPVDIVIPEPLENVPEVKFKLVIAIEEVVGSVVLARLSVRVPNVVLPPSNPKSVGTVPEPSTTIVEPLVTERSSGIEGPQAPLIVNVLFPTARTPAVCVNVPTIFKLPPSVTSPEEVLFSVKLFN